MNKSIFGEGTILQTNPALFQLSLLYFQSLYFQSLLIHGFDSPVGVYQEWKPHSRSRSLKFSIRN